MTGQRGRGADVQWVKVGPVTLEVRRSVRDAALLRASGRTYTEIGEQLGVKHSRVRQLLIELERQVCVHLRRRGVADWQTVLRGAVHDGLVAVPWPGTVVEAV